MNRDCKCWKCVSACESKPGWFLPGEAEKAAELLGLPLRAFFRARLLADWWDDWRDASGKRKAQNVFVLSPALADSRAGQEAPWDPRGQCTFLKAGLCEIHSAKPYECRKYTHDEADAPLIARKKAITAAWVEHQEQIGVLLRRGPRKVTPLMLARTARRGGLGPF